MRGREGRGREGVMQVFGRAIPNFGVTAAYTGS